MPGLLRDVSGTATPATSVPHTSSPAQISTNDASNYLLTGRFGAGAVPATHAQARPLLMSPSTSLSLGNPSASPLPVQVQQYAQLLAQPDPTLANAVLANALSQQALQKHAQQEAVARLLQALRSPAMNLEQRHNVHESTLPKPILHAPLLHATQGNSLQHVLQCMQAPYQMGTEDRAVSSAAASIASIAASLATTAPHMATSPGAVLHADGPAPALARPVQPGRVALSGSGSEASCWNETGGKEGRSAFQPLSAKRKSAWLPEGGPPKRGGVTGKRPKVEDRKDVKGRIKVKDGEEAAGDNEGTNSKGARKRAVWWPERATFMFKDVTKNPKFAELMEKHKTDKEVALSRNNQSVAKAGKVKGVYKRRSGKNGVRYEARMFNTCLYKRAINVSGSIFLGFYSTQDLACQAYDRIAINVFGRDMTDWPMGHKLNFAFELYKEDLEVLESTSTEQLIEEIREDARLYKVYNKYSPSTVLEKIRQIQQNKEAKAKADKPAAVSMEAGAKVTKDDENSSSD